jgi:hypothetical protein
MMHTYNPRTKEAKAGGSKVPGQPRLQRETLSQKMKGRKEEER